MRVDVKDFEVDPEPLIDLVAAIGAIEITRGGRTVLLLQPVEAIAISDDAR